MAKKLFDLTEDDVAALERIRQRMGARSHAEALRRLIRDADGDQGPAMVTGPKPPTPSFSHGRSKTVVVEPARTSAVGSAVPLIGSFERKPYQKTGKR